MPNVSGNLKANALTLQGHGALGNDIKMNVTEDTFVMSMNNNVLLTVAPEEAGVLNADGVTDTVISLHKNVEIQGELSTTGTVTATNFFSNQKIAEDKWHLPTPTGPFAVDIIPMGVMNMGLVSDMFGAYSAQYWGGSSGSDGTINYKDNLYATVWAPSNRTGDAKNVSASLCGAIDPTSTVDTANGGIFKRGSLGCGNCVYHPDDFAFFCGFMGDGADYSGADDSSGSYVGWADALRTFMLAFKTKMAAYHGAGTINSDPAVRADLLAKWNVVRNTETYKNLDKHFSVKTGKIWYNTQGVSLANGYKDFSVARPTDNLLANDSSCNILASTWTTAQLPTAQQIFEASGDASGCPVIFKFVGVESAEIHCSDIWHSMEMASRGYVVVCLGCCPYAVDPPQKNATNQTFIDCLFNGYLGDGVHFDFTDKATFPNLAFSMFTCGTNRIDYAYTDLSYDPTDSLIGYYGTLGVPKGTRNVNNETQGSYFGKSSAFSIDTGATSVGGSKYQYKDENGRINASIVDYCSIYYSMFYCGQVPHGSTYNNYASWEKWVYAMKYCTKFLGLDARCNFKNANSYHQSGGGFTFPMIQNLLKGTRGMSKHLVDGSSNPVYLFEILSATLLQAVTYGHTKENQGALLTNKAAPSTVSGMTSYGYAKDQEVVFTNDRMCAVPDGFTIPVLLLATTGPELFVGPNMVDRIGETNHYALLKTRLNNTVPLSRSMVYYTGMKHFSTDDAFFGANLDASVAYPTAYQFNNEMSEYSSCFSGGWSWPVPQAFDSFLFPNANPSNYNGFATIQEQLLKSDMVRTPIIAYWNIHTQGIDSSNKADGRYQADGITVQAMMQFASGSSGKLVIGPTILENYSHLDGLYRYVGPHKIETLLDTSGHNHLSLDFGKAVLFENRNNQIEIAPRPGYSAGLVLDGSGATVSVNGVTITASQWDYLVNTVLVGR